VDLRRACIGLLFLLASGCGSVSAPRGGGSGGATGTAGGQGADAAAGGAGDTGGSTGAGGSTVTDAGMDQGGADLPPKTAIWDLPASFWDDGIWGP
jgi:uncharacterized protein YceK